MDCSSKAYVAASLSHWSTHLVPPTKGREHSSRISIKWVAMVTREVTESAEVDGTLRDWNVEDVMATDGVDFISGIPAWGEDHGYHDKQTRHN